MSYIQWQNGCREYVVIELWYELERFQAWCKPKMKWYQQDAFRMIDDVRMP